MTSKEAGIIMALLRVTYPRYYANSTEEEALAAVKMWAEMFDQDDPELVAAAVKSFIACDTKGFPPHIGAIKEQMRKLAQGENGEMTELEAWELVRKASANGIYNAGAEFAKLPATIQKILGDASILREYAVTDTETLNSVMASNFQRSYKARAQHEREWMKLPADIQRLFGGEGAVKRIEKGYDEHLLPPMEGVRTMDEAREAEANDPRYSTPPPEYFRRVREKCFKSGDTLAREQAEQVKKLFGGQNQ